MAEFQRNATVSIFQEHVNLLNILGVLQKLWYQKVVILANYKMQWGEVHLATLLIEVKKLQALISHVVLVVGKSESNRLRLLKIETLNKWGVLKEILYLQITASFQ